MALVIDKENPLYAKTPSLNPEHAKEALHANVSFKNDQSAEYEVAANFSGETAIRYTALHLYTSPKVIEDAFFIGLSGTQLEDRYKKSINIPDLKSRIVKDIDISASYIKENAALTSNLGKAYRLRHPWIKSYTNTSDSQVGDTITPSPCKHIKKITLNNVKIKNLSNLNIRIESPWLIAERDCREAGKNVEITETVTFIKDRITNDEIKSETYKKLKSDLQKNFDNATVVFE